MGSPEAQVQARRNECETERLFMAGQEQPVWLNVAEILKAAETLATSARFEAQDSQHPEYDLARWRSDEAEQAGDVQGAAFWRAVQEYVLVRECVMSQADWRAYDQAWKRREWVEWPLPVDLRNEAVLKEVQELSERDVDINDDDVPI